MHKTGLIISALLLCGALAAQPGRLSPSNIEATSGTAATAAADGDYETFWTAIVPLIASYRHSTKVLYGNSG